MQLPIRNEMKQTVVKINEVQHTKANVTRWFLKARKGNPISRRHQPAIKRPNLGSRATSRNGIKWYIVWNTEHSYILFVYILTKMFPLRLDSWQMKGNSTTDERRTLLPNLTSTIIIASFLRWYVKPGGVVFSFILSSSANIKILM